MSLGGLRCFLTRRPPVRIASDAKRLDAVDGRIATPRYPRGAASLFADRGAIASFAGGVHRAGEGVALPLFGMGMKRRSIHRMRPLPDVEHPPRRLVDLKIFAQIGAFELVRREIQGGSDNFFLA